MHIKQSAHPASFSSRLSLAAMALAGIIAVSPVNAAVAPHYNLVDLGMGDALGLNQSGQVVGVAVNNNPSFLEPFITGPDGQGQTFLTSILGDAAPLAINDSGLVVGGLVIIRGSIGRAFVWDSKGMAGPVDLGTLDGSGSSLATAVNASGQIIGMSDKRVNGASPIHSFVTLGGNHTLNDMGSLGGYQTWVSRGINSSGQIVGASQSPDGIGHSFIREPGSNTLTDLGIAPGGAAAINDHGLIVGQFESSSGWGHAFAMPYGGFPGAMTDLGTLGGRASFAYALNNAGDVVGDSMVAGDRDAHAFAYDSSGGMIDLNTRITLGSGIFLVTARGINDRGQIIVVGTDRHSYLLTPVPEPETVSLMLAGLGLMGMVVHSRRRREL